MMSGLLLQQSADWSRNLHEQSEYKTLYGHTTDALLPKVSAEYALLRVDWRDRRFVNFIFSMKNVGYILINRDL